METEVRIASIGDKDGELAGFPVGRAGDRLFCGAPQFRNGAIAAVKTFRAGD